MCSTYVMIDFKGLMQGIEWEKEVKIGSTIYVPITGKLSEVSDIDVALDGEGIQISELEPESVNNVYVDSKSEGRKLVISGLIIEGGRQTRTVTRPFIIEKNEKRVIDVNCIEQGRWAYDNSTPEFQMKGKMVSRKTKSTYVQGRRNSQSSTWNRVSQMMSEHDISKEAAPTQNFMEVEEKIKTHKKKELDEIRSKLKGVFSLEEQRGVLVIEDGRVTTIEVFDDINKWNRIKDRILDANLVDTLESKEKEESTDKSARETFKSKLKSTEVEPLVDERSFKIVFHDLQGWGVGYGEQAIYLSLGWSEPMEENGNELSQVQRVQNIIPDQRIE